MYWQAVVLIVCEQVWIFSNQSGYFIWSLSVQGGSIIVFKYYGIHSMGKIGIVAKLEEVIFFTENSYEEDRAIYFI